MPATRPSPTGRWVTGSIAVIVLTVVLALVAEQTPHGRSIVTGVDVFLLKYMGVFALIGLTTAVGVGLVATDRIVMRPGHRVVAQAVHRGVSLAAITSLVAHIVLEIVAHRSQVIDAVVPFLAQNRTLYVGLGTVASDLVVLIVITGFLRGRFAGNHPAAWRALHAIAYLAWPLSIIHGLMAGRTAKPYVDWSYGACVALVALALGIRFAATIRADDEKLAHPVPDRVSVPADGLLPGSRVAMAPLGAATMSAGALGGARPGLRALPAGGALGAHTGSLPRITVQQTGPVYLNAQQMAPDQLAQQQAAEQRMAQQRMAYQQEAAQRMTTPPMGLPQMPAQRIPAPQMPAQRIPAPQMPAPQLTEHQVPGHQVPAPQPAAPYRPAPHLAGPPAGGAYYDGPAGGPHYDGPPVAPAGQWQRPDPGLQMDATDPHGWPVPPEWTDPRDWTGMPGGAQR
ncbi:MAG TPA: hypothetical protein VGG35_11990 [Streptosporangiaceae bacterium]|jgi:hypothetical protein